MEPNIAYFLDATSRHRRRVQERNFTERELRAAGGNASPLDRVQVWFHANCHDGFGAAFVAWKRFGSGATYHPVTYDRPHPEVQEGDVVFIIDFSYKRSILDKIGEELGSGSLTILDHHASAKDELEGYPGATFDLDHSGAVLAWKHFFPNEEVPAKLLYIEDRDLWNWKLPESEEVHFAMRSHDLWDGLEKLDQRSLLERFELFDSLDLDYLRQEGRPIVRFLRVLISEALSSAREVEIGGEPAQVVASPVLRSEIPSALLSRGASMAATYQDKPEGRVWSLRSKEDGPDVAKIAAKFGGGGHPEAAGFLEKEPGEHVEL